MDEKLLVSVITPTYNHEHFIGACIDSLRAQTYDGWEQIIVDDGSQDRTAEVVSRYSDPRIRYLFQRHRGIEQLPRSYNHALAAARGQLIAILEGDDIWPPDKLSCLIQCFGDESVVLAYGAVGELSSDGTWEGSLTRAVRRRRKLPKSLLLNAPIGSATTHMLVDNDLVPPSTAIIRRSALERIGGFQYVPGLCVTDFPTFLRLSLEGTFYYTPDVMGFRRRHAGSATLNHRERIAKAAHAHALDFAQQHGLKLSGSEEKRLAKSWRMTESSLEFAEGRLQLLRGEWKEARTHFAQALDPLQPRFMLASAFGWSLSWFHRDLEWAIRLAGRAAVRT